MGYYTFSSAVLSNMVATGNMWLYKFNFKLNTSENHFLSSSAPYPHVASGYSIGQYRYKTFSSPQKVILDRAALESRSIYGFIVFIKFRKGLYLISSYIFLTPFSFFFLWGLQSHIYQDAWSRPTIHSCSAIFFSLFLFMCFILWSFCCYVLNFTNLLFFNVSSANNSIQCMFHLRHRSFHV